MSTPVFDPNRPADHAPLSAQEMRDQLNALKNQMDAMAAHMANFVSRPNTVMPLDISISNPPTQGEVDAIREQLNTLLSALQG